MTGRIPLSEYGMYTSVTIRHQATLRCQLHVLKHCQEVPNDAPVRQCSSHTIHGRFSIRRPARGVVLHHLHAQPQVLQVQSGFNIWHRNFFRWSKLGLQLMKRVLLHIRGHPASDLAVEWYFRVSVRYTTAPRGVKSFAGMWAMHSSIKRCANLLHACKFY